MRRSHTLQARSRNYLLLVVWREKEQAFNDDRLITLSTSRLHLLLAFYGLNSCCDTLQVGLESLQIASSQWLGGVLCRWSR